MIVAGIQSVYFGNTQMNKDTSQKQVTAKRLAFKVPSFLKSLSQMLSDTT